MDNTVYFLLQHLRIGGVEIAVTRAANALVERGYNVCFVLVLPINQIKDQINHKIQIRTLTKLGKENNITPFYKLKRWIITCWKIRQFMKSLKGTTLISTRNEYNIMMSKFVDSTNRRIAQLHHDYKPHKGMVENFASDYSNVDYLFTLTEDVRCEIEEIMRPNNQYTKIVTIPNFISDTIIEECCKTDKRRDIAIAVGRLAPEKGFLRLLDVWKRVLDISGKKYKLYIVGEGIERRALEEKIESLAMRDIVILTGAIDNNETINLMKHSKVYCMSSLSEGFSLTILESMACATPQVAFDVRVGPRNLILQGETGYLIEDGDIDSYARKIIELLESDDTWLLFSQKSINRAYDFSESVVMDKWEKILNKH